MTYQIIKGDVAVETMKKNPHAIWPARGRDADRLEPIAKPDVKARFKITRGEPIFTIGSCFARHIEKALEDRGFVLPARELLRSDADFAAFGPSILNNYGIPSIFNEVTWGLGLQEFVHQQNFAEVAPGQFVDLHLNYGLRPAPLEEVARRRRAITEAYSQLRYCRVVIITLGLVECWHDTISGLYLNTAPRRRLMRDQPGRFELHVLDYSLARDYLGRALKALHKHGPADVKVILTVSPIPLGATYREEDVMCANSYSKSLLRVVVEEARKEFDFVDYFPSYETITLSDRGKTWEDDLVHVRPELIEFNVRRMLRMYAEADGEEVVSAALLFEELNGRAIPPARVYGRLEAQVDFRREHLELNLMFAEAATKLKKFHAANAALSLVPAGCASPQFSWVKANLLHAAGQHEGAEAELVKYVGVFGRRSLFWRMRGAAAVQRKDRTAAETLIADWCRIAPLSPEPFRFGAQWLNALGDQGEALQLLKKATSLKRVEADETVDLETAELLLAMGRKQEAAVALSNFKPTNPTLARRARHVADTAHGA